MALNFESSLFTRFIDQERPKIQKSVGGTAILAVQDGESYANAFVSIGTHNLGTNATVQGYEMDWTIYNFDTTTRTYTITTTNETKGTTLKVESNVGLIYEAGASDSYFFSPEKISMGDVIKVRLTGSVLQTLLNSPASSYLFVQLKTIFIGHDESHA